MSESVKPSYTSCDWGNYHGIRCRNKTEKRAIGRRKTVRYDEAGHKRAFRPRSFS